MIYLGRFILLACRLAIAALFLLAAYQKLFAPEFGPQKFAMAIHSFKILPDHLVLLATAAIPWMEVICAVLLIVGLWTRAAGWLLVAMLVVFTAAVASVILRHMSVTCGCFGNLTLLCPKEKLSWCKVGENALILIPTVLVAVFGGGYLELERFFSKRERLLPHAVSPIAPTPPPLPSPSKA